MGADGKKRQRKDNLVQYDIRGSSNGLQSEGLSLWQEARKRGINLGYQKKNQLPRSGITVLSQPQERWAVGI